MTKASALKRLSGVYKVFNDNLFHTVNFQLRAPDSIKYYELEKAILTQKLLLEKEENKYFLDYLHKEVQIIDQLPGIVHPMTIIYGITHFEVLLTEMTRVLMSYYSKSLITKTKSLSYEEIFKFDEIDHLKAHIIDEECNLFSFKSIRQKVEFLESKFKLNFSYVKQKGVRKNWNCIEMDDLIEIYSTRNILVHNSGIINKFYLSENPNTEYILGRKRIVNDKYSMHALFVLFRVSNSMFLVIKKKIEK